MTGINWGSHHCIRICDLTVVPSGCFILGQVSSNIFNRRLFGCDRDAQVARTADHIAVNVAVILSELSIVIACNAGLGAFLINYAIQVLFDENMVMPME